MVERQGSLFEPSFNRSVKVQATDDWITSDAGLILLRDADHRLGITESLARGLCVPRHPDRIRHQIVGLLRERVCSLAKGTQRKTTWIAWLTTRRCGSRRGTAPANSRWISRSRTSFGRRLTS